MVPIDLCWSIRLRRFSEGSPRRVDESRDRRDRPGRILVHNFSLLRFGCLLCGQDLEKVMEEEPEERISPCCSYCVSGSQFLSQEIFICETCSPSRSSNSLAFCRNCITTCHEGHAISFLTTAPSFCDCPSTRKCQLIEKSTELMLENEVDTQKLLAVLSSKSQYASELRYLKELHHFDYNGRIKDNLTNDVCTKMTLEDLPEENSKADLLLQQCLALTQLTKDTFWISHGDEPENLLEKFALEVFHYHTKKLNLEIVEDNSGAEYWCQVKDTDDSSNTKESGVDLHYDKDEFLAEALEIAVFPDISTVTYLTENKKSAPTLILDNIIEKEPGEPIHQAMMVFPKKNRHVAFGGGLLHGAPGTLTQLMRTGEEDSHAKAAAAQAAQSSTIKVREEGEGEKEAEEENDGPTRPRTGSFKSTKNIRVTLLVNIWLKHKPVSVNRLSEDHSLVLQSKVDIHGCAPTLNDTSTILKNAQLLAGFNGGKQNMTNDAANNGKGKGKEDSLGDDDDNDPTEVIFSGDSLAMVHVLNVNREYLEYDKGQWLEIPFLGSSDEVAWGSNEEDNEEKLSLQLYVPHLIQQEVTEREEHHTNNSHESNAFLLIYHDDQVAAILQGDEYDDEEEADEGEEDEEEEEEGDESLSFSGSETSGAEREEYKAQGTSESDDEGGVVQYLYGKMNE